MTKKEREDVKILLDGYSELMRKYLQVKAMYAEMEKERLELNVTLREAKYLLGKMSPALVK